MSALDMVSSRYGHPFAEDVYLTARAELAQLRATIAAQAQRIAELEAAVEQAREIFDDLPWIDYPAQEKIDAWIAAHPAPARQAQP